MNFYEGISYSTLQSSERRAAHSMSAEKRMTWAKVRKALKLVAIYQAEISLLK